MAEGASVGAAAVAAEEAATSAAEVAATSIAAPDTAAADPDHPDVTATVDVIAEDPAVAIESEDESCTLLSHCMQASVETSAKNMQT